MIVNSRVNLFWDSSALGKRYVSERGTDVVDAIFGYGWPIVTVDMVYAETANIIRRQKNLGLISRAQFEEARRDLEAEIFFGANVTLLHLSSNAIISSIDLADKYNLN